MKYDNLPQEPIHHESYDLGYQQGRADAIEEVRKAYQEKGYDGQFEDWLEAQLKSQN